MMEPPAFGFPSYHWIIAVGSELIIELKSVKLMKGILLHNGGRGGTLMVGGPTRFTVIGNVDEQVPSLIVTCKFGKDGLVKSIQGGGEAGIIEPPAAGSPSNHVKVTPPPEKIVLLSL